MERVLAKIERGVGNISSKTVVDVSNVRDRQLKKGFKDYLLVSTQKTFDYKTYTSRLPDVAVGTTWVVLSVPQIKDEKPEGSPVFDSKRRRFVSSRKRSRTRTYMERHSKGKDSPSVCSISDGKRRISGKSHSICEIDDKLMKYIVAKYDVPLITNDKELRREARRPPPLTKEESLLLNGVDVVFLSLGENGAWQRRNGRRRSR